MITHKEDKKAEMIKCSLCGYSFEKGQKNSCESCPLNYGSCNFEKCPNCGYDIPQGSYLWTLAAKIIGKLKR
jgi:hypothetical protein